jgi:hypothetical protein
MLNRGYHAARGISLVLRAPRQVGQLELAAMRHPRPACSLRFLVRARGARHQVAAGVVAGRRRSHGDAADRQRDRANGGLTLWVFLLWNFGGYRPLVISIASRAEGNPYLMALSGCEVARSGPGGGRVGGGEAIPGR